MSDIDPTKALQAAVRIGMEEAQAQAKEEIEKLRAMLKEYDDAFEDWFLFVEGRKDDPNEETKACTRLVKAQRVARAALGEKE
jgi:hypothetical protein